MQVKIEKIVYPGKSLGKVGGKVIFTDEGLPGEVAEIKPIKEKKNYAEAHTINILRPSPHRTEPRCDHYKVCAPYQYINYPAQLEIKKSQLKEIFSHDLNIELNDIKITPSQRIWEYRNKVRFRIVWDGDTPRAAYHEPSSAHTFVEIKGCSLLPNTVNSLVDSFLKILKSTKLRSVDEIAIRHSFSTGEILMALRASSPKCAASLTPAAEELGSHFPLKGMVCLVKTGRTTDEILIMGDDSIEEKIGGKTFHIGSESFFQINPAILEEMIEDMKTELKLAGSETIADIYCGVGTFGILLAQDVRKIIGVENSAENLLFLRKNLAANNIGNFSTLEGAAEQCIAKALDKRPDILILDPPRKGIGEKTAQVISASPVPNIVYVSCNPSTLARDLKTLLNSHKIKHLQIYDFFPQTPHIETCVLLKR